MTAEEKRICAGFEIIEAISIEKNTEIVLGKKEHGAFGTEYVTWFCRDKTDYCHGHYLCDYHAAKVDLLKRALFELGVYEL